MTKFLLGFLTALAIYQGPSIARRVFRDQPVTPENWRPRYRTWHEGEEIL